MSRDAKVVVIGGGMAGLTAAAYLAQRGVGVELFEQHYRLGGCCTSFQRRQFVWDAAVHAVGGCHEGGVLRGILEELGVWDRVEFVRANPMDVVISPYYRVRVWVEQEAFLDELRQAFPGEMDRLVRLVQFLYGFGTELFGRWGQASFRDVLDHYLRDDMAKTVFMAPLGNLGISSRRVGAIAGCVLWRDNQLQGGFAPKGSFQRLADAMGQRIEELGGRVHRRTEIDRLEVRERRIVAAHARPMVARLGEERRVDCDVAIGAGSATALYTTLIGREHLPGDFVASLERMQQSFTGVIAFLGLDYDVLQSVEHHGCHWYVHDPRADAVDDILERETIERQMFDDNGWLYAAFPSGHDPSLAPPGKSTAVLIIPAVHKPREYWQEHKERVGDAIVRRGERIVPGLAQHIERRYVATSATIEHFTRNDEGSYYGWAVTPEQAGHRRLGRVGPLGGLYLAGHWTQPGPGLINAAKSGQLTAKAVLRQLRKDGFSLREAALDAAP